MSVEIPADFHHIQDLGQPVKVYKPSFGARLSGFLSFFIFLGIGGGLFLFLNFFNTSALDTLRQSGLETYTLFISYGLPGFLALLAVFHLFRGFSEGRKLYVVYEHGVAFRQRGVQAWKWADIVSTQAQIIRYTYYGFIPAGTTKTYYIVHISGGYLVLNQTIAQVEQLANDIQAGVMPIRLQQAQQTYDAGQPVTFGPVLVNKEGIQLNRKMYKWEEIQSLSISNGTLSIAKKGGGFFSGASASTFEIHNLEVLLGLLQYAGGQVNVS